MAAQEFLSITVKDNKNLLTQIDDIFNRGGLEAQRRVGEILYQKTRSELTSRKYDATHGLVGSLKIELGGATINSLVSIVTYDIAASALEYGSRPHEGTGPKGGEPTVNIDNIIEWMQAKGVRAKNGDDRSYAYAIARNIARKGMTLNGNVVKNAPRRPFNAAQKKASREINRYWEQIVASIVGRVNSL